MSRSCPGPTPQSPRPEVDSGLDRVLVDRGELLLTEWCTVQSVEVRVELLDRGGADDRRGDTPVANGPPQRHLCELLSAGPGDLVEPPDVPEGCVVEMA